MLTPKQIQEIADTMYPVVDGLNVWITKDIIRRVIARMTRDKEVFLTATDEWQLLVYQEAGGHLDAVKKEIAKWTKLADKEIERIFEDAGIKALEYDNAFYRERGLPEIELAKSEGMLRILEDTCERTENTIHNFTRTTAQASQEQLIQVLDDAHFKVISGSTSYSKAVQEATDSLIQHQARVYYPTGHTDTIEVAVLRAVRTGTAQAAGNMAVQGMEERDWDTVLVSAHLGARYGDGGENPSNHSWWQGKFYSRTGRNKDLPPFLESTGYGTGEGLCGWNCRHSFGPGDIRHNPYEQFDAEENKKAYDISQNQRQIERSIRHTKEGLVALRTAIDACLDEEGKKLLEQDYANMAGLLERQNILYQQYCKKNDLKPLMERIQIASWMREDARRSIAAAKSLHEKEEKEEKE